ncbi:hypothetical protein VNO80_20504 [Phaseolus coccineus]|uniref:Uncharacterized protein n=1 Tax=Phaseolus coccineus TaxID=3886 RepID=A0AAN9M1B6_PHACN
MAGSLTFLFSLSFPSIKFGVLVHSFSACPEFLRFLLAVEELHVKIAFRTASHGDKHATDVSLSYWLDSWKVPVSVIVSRVICIGPPSSTQIDYSFLEFIGLQGSQAMQYGVGCVNGGWKFYYMALWDAQIGSTGLIIKSWLYFDEALWDEQTGSTCWFDYNLGCILMVCGSYEALWDEQTGLTFHKKRCGMSKLEALWVEQIGSSCWFDFKLGCILMEALWVEQIGSSCWFDFKLGCILMEALRDEQTGSICWFDYNLGCILMYHTIKFGLVSSDMVWFSLVCSHLVYFGTVRYPAWSGMPGQVSWIGLVWSNLVRSRLVQMVWFDLF